MKTVMYDKTEGMDLKKLILFLLKKLWLLLVLSVAGGLLGGGVYLFYHTVISPNREYQAFSKVYLNFAPDETGEVYQAYNGYTWNDLIATSRIMDETLENLSHDYTAEEVREAVSATILSDLRLLTVTVTTDDPAKTETFLHAVDKALVTLGEQAREFRDIEVIQEDSARLLVVDDRLFQAVLLGVLLAFAAALLGMALWYVLDDGIYVAGDLKSVTDLPFVGYLPAGETRGAIGERLAEDTEKNRAYLEQKTGRLERYVPGEAGAEEALFDRLRQADGVLLELPYGRLDRAKLAYELERLALQDCNVVGVTIKDADVRFLRWYYNHL